MNKMQSSQFLSKAPKTSIYCFDEKRINDLYGEKPNLKYKIKMNDEILDKQRAKSHSSQGKLIFGSAVANLTKTLYDQKSQGNSPRVEERVGPTDYNPVKVTKKITSAIINSPHEVAEPPISNVRDQMEHYLNKIIKKNIKKNIQTI